MTHESLIYTRTDGTFDVAELMEGKLIKVENVENRQQAVNVALYMERVYGTVWDRLSHTDEYCACDFCNGTMEYSGI